MKIDRMVYSYEAVNACIEKTEALTMTVRRKDCHFWKCWQIHGAYEFCFDQTSCFLFDPHYSAWRDYQDDLNRGATKKVLDQDLRRCVRELRRLCREILDDMNSGAVDTVA